MLGGVGDIATLGWALSALGEPDDRFVAQMLALDPDVVVLAGVGADSRWLLERVPILVATRPMVRVLAIVWAARPGWIAELADAGASGIADVAVTAEQLCGAVRTLAAGQDWVSPSVVEQMARQQREVSAGRGFEPLSPREWQVLSELVQGSDNATIAARLGISTHTVAGHVHVICAKLHAATRLQAAIIAIRTGLVGI